MKLGISNSTFIFLIIFGIDTSAAMEFGRHNNNSKTLNAIFARGQVEPGDTDKLLNYFRGLPAKNSTEIYLSSPGGNLYESMALGRFFKNKRIKTVVEEGETCASACALAFLGGRDENGKKWMSTSTTSILGFHAFSNGDEIKYEDPDYTLFTVSNVLEYGKEVEVPIDFFIKKFGTPSNRMYSFTNDALLNLGIKVWDDQNDCFLPCQSKFKHKRVSKRSSFPYTAHSINDVEPNKTVTKNLGKVIPTSDPLNPPAASIDHLGFR
ncbi:MAG: hypothetical protein ACR2PH_16690 [Desulfobulbia bacterium]